ncbi:phosphoglycerate mutase [Stenotrophomonas sp. 24(2023)]|uniref:phosphoglycerate mutase n=1 Tax=Stenotrophomonas sp. 24(2023) TaxID=3068324 RepID=UPI0027E2105B|nr:phosphoglycerate mutase [Stenotrophomonas sp. 24(2023)]WMJ69047.1 phosphoglycerate mutase [Stenotrophomonas sp. 24(2023)]
MATATLLLPARSRFAAAALPDDVSAALGRAEQADVAAGEREQLQRHFTVAAPDWPVAALTRQLDVGDAAGASWLRADPAYVVPDMQGARMMGHGDTLRPDAQDSAALLPALQALFAESGFTFDAPSPSRWYLRLPIDLALPRFAAPDEVLGDDLFAHLPDGDAGRRWRALLTEAQVVLHTHPWNQQRLAAGKQPINSLWFWGPGVMPVAVSTRHAQVRSRDALLRGLAQAAGVAVDGEQTVDALVDLRQLRSLQQLGTEAIPPLLAALKRGELQTLVLDFEDGRQFTLDRRQRWKFWKKPRQLHDA